MLSNFLPNSIFSPPETPEGRFENCTALKNIFPFWVELHQKEIELQKKAELNGEGSLDYKKSVIISKLISELDQLVNDFNQSEKNSHRADELKAIIQLTNNMHTTIQSVLNLHENTLSEFRDHHREMLQSGVKKITYVATVGVSVLAPVTFVGSIFGLTYAAPKLSEKAVELTGLNDNIPRTLSLLKSFSEALLKINENLSSLICNTELPFKPNNHPAIPNEFLCPILGCVMTDATYCTLDHQTYERSAIEKWLTEHGTSPLNRKKIKSTQSIKDVLLPNKSIQTMITNARKENPNFFEEEHKQHRKLSK